MMKFEMPPNIETSSVFDGDNVSEFVEYVEGIRKAISQSLNVVHTDLEVYAVIFSGSDELSFHVEFAGRAAPGKRLSPTFVDLDFPYLEKWKQDMVDNGHIRYFCFEHHSDPDRAWCTIGLPKHSTLKKRVGS